VVKTIKEFRSEVKMIRREMYRKGNYADTKLVASWLDRLCISLEGVSVKLDLMMQDIEELNEAMDSCTCGAVKKKVKKSKKKVKKKAKKKTKKKAKKKKKR
jgi:hypothetical protein